jgi:Asp/Glu/hydantoin racemase
MGEILWVNPVGTGAFDADTSELIEAVRSPQHTARIRHLDQGPPHLEYHLYEHAALGPMLRLMREAEAQGCVAGVIGCFYDGGLRELREGLRMPVVGMAEAALYLACSLGHRFSIIVGRRKWIPKMTDNLILQGLERRLASFRSVEMGIPQIAADPDGFYERVLAEGRKAVHEDGAEVVVLSEIASPLFWARAGEELPVPLVDPGVACWKWAELAGDLYQRLGLSHCKLYGFEPPPAESTPAESAA